MIRNDAKIVTVSDYYDEPLSGEATLGDGKI